MAPFLGFLGDLPWQAWAAMFGALCVGALAGGLVGWYEAENAFHSGQSPTLAQLRVRVQRMRALFNLFGGPRSAVEELHGFERDLRDLAVPPRRRRKVAP